MYIFYLAFYKKGDVWGKNVCSPRPAPTIQSSLLHSTKPKSPSKGRVGTPGEQILFTDTGRWSLIRSGLTPKETNKQANGTENPKAKPFQNEMDFHLSCTQAKNFKPVGGGGGKSHCKQLDFVKLSWEDPTPLGSICNLKKKKRQLFYMDIETQLKSNICQLVNTGKQSWQKGKKKKKREKEKDKKRNPNTAN